MDIKSLIAKDKSVEVSYPDIDDFKVEIGYISREELLKIRKKCASFRFDKKTRQKEEDIDDALFTKLYVQKAILGWSGLKLEHLREFIPLEADNVDPETVIDYTEENALMLMRESTVFDSWVGDMITNVENFN